MASSGCRRMTSSFLRGSRLEVSSAAGGRNWMRISTLRSFRALPAFKMKGTPSHLWASKGNWKGNQHYTSLLIGAACRTLVLIEGPAWLHSKGLSLLSFRKAKGISEGGQQLRGAHECSSPEHRGANHTIGCRYSNHQAFRALPAIRTKGTPSHLPASKGNAHRAS